MGRPPPCDINRFVLQPIFVHDALDKRERIFRSVQMKGVAFQTSWEFHPSVVLTKPPSLPATVLSRSDCDWTEVSLMPLPVMAFGEDALHRRSPEYIGNHFCCLTVCSLLWLAGFADSRGKVKNALYYSVFKEQRKQQIKIASHFPWQKVRGLIT